MKKPARLCALALCLSLIFTMQGSCFAANQLGLPGLTALAAETEADATTADSAESTQETETTQQIIVAQSAESESDEAESSDEESGNPFDLNYASSDNWVYYAYEDSCGSSSEVDVFFVAPTVQSGSDGQYNLNVSDSSQRKKFAEAINLERDIYAASARFYAPYYREVNFNVYSMEDQDAAQQYYDLAYADVRDAFLYYLENCNDGRPFILAGFSQGASICLELLEEFFDDEELAAQLVACYAIGWPVTQNMVDEYPQLKMAQGEDDTGVIISYNSEATYITSSSLVPEGMKTLSINPLNWTTDGTYASAEENLGACFCDPSTGEVMTEYEAFTGAYLDPVRGTLKVTDADPATYTANLGSNADGMFHIYEFIFFYRNLQENVATRIAAYCG